MSRTINDDSDDAPRDAHLLAALRHAPDRDEAPPPQVTARILAAARAAAGPAPSSWSQRLASMWRSPQLGAAFGTLAVAALVGVMWSTREPPAVPQSADSAPIREAAPSATAPLPAASAAPPSDLAAADAGSTRGQTVEPPRTPAPAARENSPRSAAKAQAPQRAREAKGGERAAVSPAPPATGGAAQASPEAVADAPPSAARDSSAALPPRPVTTPAPAALPAEAASGEAALRTRQEAARAPTPASSALLGRLASSNAAAAAADPLLRVEALLRDRGARWQPSAAAHGAAQQAWWLSVVELTRGRWVRLANPAVPIAPWLLLASGGQPQVAFWFQDDGLALQVGGEVWQVTVPQAQRREWEEAVARW
jgi:hypothetical protein